MTTTKLSAAEQRARREDRVAAIRLRMLIGSELDARGIVSPAAVGEVLGMPAVEAQGLLTRRQWRERGIWIVCGRRHAESGSASIAWEKLENLGWRKR